MLVSACAEILGVGDYRTRALKEYTVLARRGQGDLREGFGLWEPGRAGEGQSYLQRGISWLRTEGILSNWEVAAAGRGAA